MDPLRFETPSGLALYGAYHPPANAGALPTGGASVAVLFLPPLGQEAIRAHRLSRVLADRLARQGQAVLRFDYRGTGDSDGDDLDADLTGWRQDVVAAHQLLIARSGCSDVRWLGFRVGFTVGLQVAGAWSDRDGPPPTRLVGWDPVLDGPDYLAELATAHAAALRVSYSLPQVPEAELARLARDPELTEAMGFALSPTMVSELRAIAVGHPSRDGLPWPQRTAVAAIRSRSMRPVVAPGGAAGIARSTGAVDVSAGAAASVGGFSIEDVDVDFDWVSEEALNTPLVPDQALRRLLHRLGLGPREA
jgi:pimeloyl-ACP methyl ester carboxylesterase